VELLFIEGRLRVVREPDGFFVVGEGMVLPVNSYEEGLELVRHCEEEVKSFQCPKSESKKE
jgi:hypothetical protein